MIRFTIFFIILFISSVAQSNVLHEYRVLKIIDGDTVEIEANYLPDPLKKVLKLRLYGIDTPEKGFRAKCEYENMRALKAKLFTEQEISKSKVIKVEIKSWDKYGGRVLGDLILDGERLTDRLEKNGYGVKYFGKKKPNWCIR